MGALIVFLPGLTGNDKTWGIIPSLIKRTPGIDFEVATETYSTGIFSPSDLSRSAAVILTRLENQYAAYSPIYLVGHSLGGLVAREACRQLLVADRSKDSLLDTVQAVITLGTPIEGSNPWRFSSLVGAWNAALSRTPFLGKKVKQIGDPKANYERYKEALEQRIQIQKDDPSRKARRPKQIHIELEDDLAVVGNTKRFHTIDDTVGGTVAGSHRNFAGDAEQATSLADLIISLIRNVQNAANPAHLPSVAPSADADLPSVLVLFACSRTKLPGGDKGHDGSTAAASVLPLELRRRIVNKRSNIYGLIKDGKIVDAFDIGANRVHQRANQSLYHGPDLGGLESIGENCFYLPAWQRYTGRSYVPISSETWLEHFSKPEQVTVMIMSGLYGLIDAKEKIQDYDVHLSDSDDKTGQLIKSMWSELYTETIASYVERAFRGGERVKIFNLLCDTNYVTAVKWAELPRKKCTVYHLASPTAVDVNLLPAAGTVLNRLLLEPAKAKEIQQGVMIDLSDFGQPPKNLSDLKVVFDRRVGDTNSSAD
jgi:hypothetical protein